MIITDTSVVNGAGLASVEVIGDKIKLVLKNGSTLTFSPKVEDQGAIEYDIEYLTGKENKQIEKLQKKIQELEAQVSNIKENGSSGNSGTAEGLDDTDYANSEEVSDVENAD